VPEAPTHVQLLLVIAAAVAFAASGGVSAARVTSAAVTAALSGVGLLLAAAALITHSITRNNWLPLRDNFDALVWLAFIIGAASLYLQRRTPVGRIEWIASPVIVVLLVCAAAFGAARPHEYTNTLWAWTHRIGVYTGPAVFALAACTGVMYLLLRKKLRSKVALEPGSFGNLERLEQFNFRAIRVGFVLLSIGIFTGLGRVLQHETSLGNHWFWQPKVLLSTAAFVLYAVVLHSPINPAFNGKKNAICSIAGFLLLLATIVVVQQMK
jgi:ABC-type uncharacterized transport system permease subunit